MITHIVQSRSVDDIDLYVGGLLENGIKPIRTVGPTFQKILMKQFAELKNGDRFFYENDISPGKFTLGKLIFN